jgi:hypothetical protein
MEGGFDRAIFSTDPDYEHPKAEDIEVAARSCHWKGFIQRHA